MAVLLECHVLHDRGQLVVVSNEHDTLEPADSILLPLHSKQNLASISLRAMAEHLMKLSRRHSILKQICGSNSLSLA